MYWYHWWLGAMIVWGIAVVDAIAVLFFRYKRKRILTPNRVLILGTCGAASIMLYPLYLNTLEGSLTLEKYVKTGLVSLQHAIRLFAFDGDYRDIVDMVKGLEPEIQMLYTMLGAVLYLIAPILTVGLILSFFQNLTSYLYYICSFWKKTHVFSELNEKSLALAKSIDDKYNKKTVGKKSKKRRYRFWKRDLIVFTDVINMEDEESLDLIDEAKELGAILFTKDLGAIKYRNRYLSVRRMYFYLISEDEEEKIRHAESIMRDYDFSEKHELRLFSDDIRSELLLGSSPSEKMKVIRVNDIQTLIYHNLDVHGQRLFENARETGGAQKTISAVIVGLGKYGLEMTKALTWFCQLTGYKIKINAFDADEQAEAKFSIMCPELMNSNFNGQDIPGEAHYEIKIHSGININSPAFFEEFSKIKDATYVFVCLGDDKTNLSAAVAIRTHCEQIHYIGDHRKPDIETVIYDSNIRNTMGIKWEPDTLNQKGATNFKKQYYQLHMIGDLDHFYCVDTLIDSDLVKEGLQGHLRYYEEREFWQYEYNYRSSITKAIHMRLREKMQSPPPGMDKSWDEMSYDEKCEHVHDEHIRWNAYMRSEGYQYSGRKEASSRNDLGKLHHNLVSVYALPVNDLRKDAHPKVLK